MLPTQRPADCAGWWLPFRFSWLWSLRFSWQGSPVSLKHLLREHAGGLSVLPRGRLVSSGSNWLKSARAGLTSTQPLPAAPQAECLWPAIHSLPLRLISLPAIQGALPVVKQRCWPKPCDVIRDREPHAYSCCGKWPQPGTSKAHFSSWPASAGSTRDWSTPSWHR